MEPAEATIAKGVEGGTEESAAITGIDDNNGGRWCGGDFKKCFVETGDSLTMESDCSGVAARRESGHGGVEGISGVAGNGYYLTPLIVCGLTGDGGGNSRRTAVGQSDGSAPRLSGQRGSRWRGGRYDKERFAAVLRGSDLMDKETDSGR
jgi:hypothetical protein